MQVWDFYWNRVLEFPLGCLHAWFNLDVQTSWKALSWKIACSVVLVVLIYEIILRIKSFIRNRVRNERALMPDESPNLLSSDPQFAHALEAARGIENAVAPLKKARKYADVAAAYASVNKHRDAAKWYGKAGDRKSAAVELARAGKTLKAAKLLEKIGEFLTAARFYEEKNKFADAARVYTKMGHPADAAEAYAKAGKPVLAADGYLEYFQATKDALDLQTRAAENCYQLLSDEAARTKIGGDEARQLMLAVATRFEQARKNEQAARLFLQAGDLVRAGQIFLRLGNLEEARKCMQQAGRTREAAEIGARYYETKGLWKEAGMAYEGADHFRRAGDCFSKANDPVRAAQCYGRAGEYYGAGLALVHAKQWEQAIHMLQQVKEDNPHFNEARGLLGRCFYELKDYAHCAATLENHLTGERVGSGNIDYFWMLALALEQLGELGKSKEILMKIRSVNVAFRDVDTRLSSIDSRISMGAGTGPAVTPSNAVTSQGTAVMEMVEKSVGERYKLERELGRGGMGVVYLAQDTQLDRLVALKFLGSLVDGSDEYRQRFSREARAAAKVSHANIIGIYDISVSEGRSYIVMEYVEGPNLHKYVQKKGPLEAREAINIIVQACSALEAVHAAGIIHRDIKPDNILIAKGGLVKLMDFGLAKAGDMRLTGTNVIMGTPCYMSPEQVRGEQADPRSDLYAMGLVLYELLTAKTVFVDGDVLQRQLTETPPAPGAIVPGVPPELDAAILKCIAKDPADRFQSVREFIDALRAIGKD